jgi:hypothetical protein
MSQEIQATISLIASKAGISISEAYSLVFDMAGDDMGTGTQLIGTADEQIVFPPDVASAKLLGIVNFDATNYVQISYGTGGSFSSFSRLDAAPSAGSPGGIYFGKPESLTIYAKANTAACRIKWFIVEE